MLKPLSSCAGAFERGFHGAVQQECVVLACGKYEIWNVRLWERFMIRNQICGWDEVRWSNWCCGSLWDMVETVAREQCISHTY